MKAVSFSLLYFLVNLGSVPGTYIYESINWVPQNPIFKAEGKPCNNTGPRYLKVELQSTAIFICPNTATVLQKSSVGIQPANMYENLWLLYNKTAFDNCDVSLDPKRKRLLGCNTPGLLNYISVQFAQHTADPDGLRFKGGHSYYFIATSDGTESNLNSTRGGHCDDTRNNVHMKLEVYVCHNNQTYTDPRCRSHVGKVQCSAEEITHTTATAPSTQPHTTVQTVPSQTTERRSSTKYTASVKEIVTGVETRLTTAAATTTTDDKKTDTAEVGARCGNDVDLLTKEVQVWKLLAIISLICCLLLVVALLIYWRNCFGLNKGSNCPAKGRISNSYPETLPHKPLETQESIIGVSNHGFAVDRHSVYYGDDKRVPNGVSSFGTLPNRCSIYENVDGSQPTLTSTEGDTEVVLEKDAGIFIQNGDVYYHNDGEKEKGNGNSPV